MMKKQGVVLAAALFPLFLSGALFISVSAAAGTIRGTVILPNKIELAAEPNEARVIIYVMDVTPEHGKPVMPWDAPIRKVIDYEIKSLKNHRVSFEFGNLPKGIYGVSVLVDTGRPHVPPGSLNFAAFPGDYAGGTRENLPLDDNQTIEVSIGEGFYVTIPEGYAAPLYSPE